MASDDSCISYGLESIVGLVLDASYSDYFGKVHETLVLEHMQGQPLDTIAPAAESFPQATYERLSYNRTKLLLKWVERLFSVRPVQRHLLIRRLEFHLHALSDKENVP